MVITKAIKQKLQQSSNNVPERVTSRGSNALRLKLVDGTSVMLLDSKGKVTESGKYWYDEVQKSERPQEGYDPHAELIRRHRTDYIKMRNGREQIVRVYRPELKNYTYTPLGRQFFADKPRRAMVHIPVIFDKGEDPFDESKWMGFYDAKSLGGTVKQIVDNGVAGFDHAERRNNVKDLILRALVKKYLDEQYGQRFEGASNSSSSQRPSFEETLEKVNSKEIKLTIAQDSEVNVTFDPTKIWEYSMEVISGIDEPQVTTTAILNRPLNGLRLRCVNPENVMDEAFVEGDGMNCVVRQICAKYNMSKEEVEAEIDDISEAIAPGREEGVTAMQILEWCKRHGVNGYIVHNAALIAKYEVNNQDHNLPALCVQIVGGHAYFMKTAKRWQHARVSDRQPPLPRKLYVQPKPSKDPVFEEWTKWQDSSLLPMEEDHYWFDGDMKVVRDAYIRNGIVTFKLMMKDFLSIRKIIVPDYGGREVTIHSVPEEYQSILEFTKQAGIAYRGEGMPSVTQKVLLRLLRPERKDPSKTLRAEIIGAQGSACAKCGTVCKLEMDHVHKISRDPFNRNGKDNLVGLCSECHMQKTLAQAGDPEYNPMLSYFNEHTWNNFVLADRPRQQIYRSGKIDDRVPCQNVDIVRCRRNALASGGQPWYVFSIWDDIEPRTEMQLSSFNYVSKRAPRNATEMVNEAPHVGPSWRTAEVCAYLLGRGIITWDDITHGLDATCKLPPTYFTKALDQIDEMWDQTSKPNNKKLAINSMIGLWANPNNYIYSCTTEEPGFTDTLFEGIKRTRVIEEFGLEQVIRQYEQVSNACMVPIHMQILDAEQLLLARMRTVLTTDCGLTLRNIKECRVDSCLIQAGNRREEVILEKLQQYIRHDEVTDTDYLRALKAGDKYTMMPERVAAKLKTIGQRDLHKIEDWLGPIKQIGSCASKPVFRAESLNGEKLIKTRLKGEYKLPISDAEPPESSPEWTWHTLDSAFETVLAGNSIFISGIGGTGKSYTMKRMVEQLQAKDIHVKIIAKCHVAALNAGQGLDDKSAMTAQAFVHQYNSVGGFTQGVLVLEELMTMDTGLLHAISSRKKMGVQFIVLGDRNQHPAIGDSFNGIDCDEASLTWRDKADRENNNWIKTMCDCNRLHLTEPKRCAAEDPLWDFYSSIRMPTLGVDDGGYRIDLDMEEMLDIARKLFPLRKHTQWNLTLSHRTRMRLNTKYNEMGSKGRKDAVWVEKSERPSPNEPQSFWLYPGLIMIAYISQGKAGSVHNGQLFETQWFANDVVTMRDIESNEIHELTLEFVRHNLRLGFAFTNVGCQGRSLGNFESSDGPFPEPERGVTIWDTESKHFALAHLFTGTSRCRFGELLQVA